MRSVYDNGDATNTLSEKFLPNRIKSPIDHIEQELFRAFFLGADYLDTYTDSERMVSILYQTKYTQQIE